MQAIRTLCNEHRSLAAVLHGLLHLVRNIHLRQAKPDFTLLRAMIHYIDAFPERFHHPKEDAYLFRTLRMRNPAAAPLLDRLEEEHRIGARKIRLLAQTLERYALEGDRGFASFAATVSDYAAFHWNHMQCEETEVLPLAARFLTPDDWQLIDTAFEGHGDPLLGKAAGDHYDALFDRIVQLAPAPLGKRALS